MFIFISFYSLLLKYISLISGFNFLIFSLILLLKKSTIRKPNMLLGFTFLTMTAFNFLMYFLYNTSLSQSYSQLAYYVPMDYFLALLMGPGIFFYLQAILGKNFKICTLKIGLHILPALPSLVFAAYFISLPTPIRIEKLIGNFEKNMWQVEVLNLIFYIQMTLYLVFCLIQVNKQLAISRKVMVGTTQIDIKWLKTFFTIDLVMMVVTAPVCFWIANDKVSSLIGLVVMNIQFIYIFIKSTWQTGLFPEITITPNKVIEPILKISDEVIDKYYDILMAYMKTDKIYLNPGCTVPNVAKITNIPPHHLSYLINTRLNKNFFDFVNEYRINEAQKMLIDKKFETYTLEAIGYQCGFGSKTTFNKAFKKQTNLTPSEFRQLNGSN